MWKTFLTAIGLLLIALMGALYSSGAARDGDVRATGISALLALGMAIWVGIRFLPRLATHVDWGWLPFFSHYRITRDGWVYFAAVTIVVFAAINTANNLLYMVLSALLGLLVLSGFLSALNFRFLQLEVRLPSRCFTGELFPISLQIVNQKRVFPAFSIHVEPAENSDIRFPAFYIGAVRSLAKTSRQGQARITRRGRFHLRKLKASSRYPFGFFLKDRTYALDAECICYPEIMPPDEMNVSSLDLEAGKPRFERGLGHDLYMIRDYVASDSARHVDWKASAKTLMLKTREYAAEESRRVILAFDRFGRPADRERFEQLVSYTASLAYHLINDGIAVSLVTDEWRTTQSSPNRVLDTILDYLALVEMSSTAEIPIVEGAFRLTIR